MSKPRVSEEMCPCYIATLIELSTNRYRKSDKVLRKSCEILDVLHELLDSLATLRFG